MAANAQKLAIWQRRHRRAQEARITLEQSEIHRLRAVPQRISVISGCAWVSWQGQDIILREGEKYLFSRGNDDPIISAVGGASLVFDLLP